MVSEHLSKREVSEVEQLEQGLKDNGYVNMWYTDKMCICFLHRMITQVRVILHQNQLLFKGINIDVSLISCLKRKNIKGHLLSPLLLVVII